MHTFNAYSYNDSQLVLMGGCVGNISSSRTSSSSKQYNFGDEEGVRLTNNSHCETVHTHTITLARAPRARTHTHTHTLRCLGTEDGAVESAGKPETSILKPQTPNPKPQTPNPKL